MRRRPHPRAHGPPARRASHRPRQRAAARLNSWARIQAWMPHHHRPCDIAQPRLRHLPGAGMGHTGDGAAVRTPRYARFSAASPGFVQLQPASSSSSLPHPDPACLIQLQPASAGFIRLQPASPRFTVLVLVDGGLRTRPQGPGNTGLEGLDVIIQSGSLPRPLRGEARQRGALCPA